MSDTLELTKALINRASVTPVDAGCQALIRQRLEPLGFVCETHQFGDVTNLWARRGTNAPLFVLAGHTDVVPVGDTGAWTHPPFTATENNDYLFGRGAVDMKGALAAMITATERYLTQTSTPMSDKLNLAFLITSDEEDGKSGNGTQRVINTLSERGIDIDYCLVGEPSSEQRLGDVIKNGRRGSLSGRITFIGQQGHIAYPEKAHNPIPDALRACLHISEIAWDEGNAHFPATQCQFSTLRAGSGVSNMIPAEITVDFNLRYSDALTHEQIKSRIQTLLNDSGIEHEITWHLSGEPYLTQPGRLLDVVSAAVQNVTGYAPTTSTAGGTSDGRFIAPTGAEVIECGLLNQTAHQVDERVAISDLDTLAEIYYRVLCDLCQG